MTRVSEDRNIDEVRCPRYDGNDLGEEPDRDESAIEPRTSLRATSPVVSIGIRGRDEGVPGSTAAEPFGLPLRDVCNHGEVVRRVDSTHLDAFDCPGRYPKDIGQITLRHAAITACTRNSRTDGEA